MNPFASCDDFAEHIIVCCVYLCVLCNEWESIEDLTCPHCTAIKESNWRKISDEMSSFCCMFASCFTLR